MYLTETHPDIMYAVCLISRYMSKPTLLHFQIAKRILSYLKGTENFGIHYEKSSKAGMHVFSDSDYVWDVNDRKAQVGICSCLELEQWRGAQRNSQLLPFQLLRLR